MNFKRSLKSMYTITILFLILIDAILSFRLDMFPTNLALAVLTTTLIDVMLQKIFRKQIRFPSSAFISGLIIGSVAPFVSPFYVVVVAGIIAIFSKFLIRYKGSHIFNPAALGLITSLAIFSLGDEWWGGNSIFFSGILIPISFLLIISNYKAMKLKVAGSFLLVTLALSILFSYSTIISTINFINLVFTLPFFFAFIMVSEPKTSPYGTKKQILFGMLIAVLSFFLIFFGIKYALLLSLLIGNFVFFLSKNLPKKDLQKESLDNVTVRVDNDSSVV